MYMPRAFSVNDLSALDRLMARDNFVTLVTSGNSCVTVSHLPVLYFRDGNSVELRGHWARPNPQSLQAGAALAIVHGPHAYISPSWYPDEDSAGRVPTWNYAVAHLEGELSTFDDESDLASLVDELSRQHESQIGGAWRYRHERAAVRAQLKAIVGFRMVVRRIELKFKLNQNHPRENRIAVVGELSAHGRQDSRDIAELMRLQLDSVAT